MPSLQRPDGRTLAEGSAPGVRAPAPSRAMADVAKAPLRSLEISMGNTIGKSFGWGALFGTIAAFTTASCMSYFWATGKTGGPGQLSTLMILWVPAATIMGGIAAAVLFAMVGATGVR